MPGFDGTGPRGFGPMSGWGRGFCGTGAGPRYGRGPGRGFGGGFGRGFAGGSGGGRGRGWRHRHFAYGPGRGFGRGRWQAPGWGPRPCCAADDPEAMKEELRYYADNLQTSLNAVQEQLAELERRRDDAEA